LIYAINRTIIKHGGKKMKEKSEVELLKEFKKKSGWSYQKLANNLGVHYQTVVAWFSGKYSPSYLAKEKIERFLMIKSEP
jgi:ribosome-binding protein aMBF1 (putative translation factor)